MPPPAALLTARTKSPAPCLEERGIVPYRLFVRIQLQEPGSGERYFARMIEICPRYLLALLTIAITSVAGACSSQLYAIRYKLTVEIDDDGKLLTQSSIIEVNAWKNSVDIGGPGAHGGSAIHGVAPIFDLGRNGWLVLPLRASMSSDKWLPLDARKCPEYFWTFQPIQLPETVYKLDKEPSTQIRDLQKVQLTALQRPAFYWFPGPTWDSGREICGNELPDVISPSISVRSITIEPTNEPLRRRVDPAPPWLEDARRQGYRIFAGYSDIEAD